MQANILEVDKGERLIQLVIFHIRNQEFGIPIEEIQEIIKVGNITPIPDSPDFIRGIINVRGDIVTTIDMKARFAIQGKGNELGRHVIITKQDDNLFGLMVDEVTEVLRVDKKEIKPPPALIADFEKEYVTGIVVYESRLLILLDLSKVLSQAEFANLAEIARKHKNEVANNLNHPKEDTP